jgi:hypothetical protein
MPDNYVEVTVAAKDDTGRGFASTDAKAKAFSRTMSDTFRAQVRGHMAAAEAEGAHMRATRLLADAEKVLGDRAEHTSASSGRLATLFSSLLAPALSGITSAFGGLWSAMSSTQAAGVSLSVWLLGLAPLTAAAAVAFAPLIASLGLVAAGIGTFAAVAVPELSKVWSAVSAGGKAWRQLSPAEKEAGRELRGVQGEFHKLAKAVQPQVLKAFASGLRIIKDVLPALTPLAVAAGKALDGFLKRIDQWLHSPSGQKFIKWMEVDGPKAIAAFGRVMWDLTVFLGHWADNFYTWGQTIGRDFRTTVHNLAHGIDSARTGFIQLGHEVESVFNDIKGWVASAVGFVIGKIHELNSALAGIPGSVLGTLGHALFGLASGGIAGAAAGGLRSGLKLVGEHGPELVQMPAGSRVYNAGQTQQMLGAGGGGGVLRVELVWAGGQADSEFMTWLAKNTRIRGGDPRIYSRKVQLA